MTDRRSFLRGSSVLLGSAALGSVLQAFAATPRKAPHFGAQGLETLRVLVDIILPATDSPAASAADTHYFVDMAVPACASARAQETFSRGLRGYVAQLEVDSTPELLVGKLRGDAAYGASLEYDQSFFKILKDYTLVGYFLSETGATKALAYERVPGGYRGDLPLAPNQKAWAI
jgi:hypothetical protein